jgi:hypothetical protein
MTTEEPFVLAVVTNPKPHNILTFFEGDGSVVNTNSSGPEPSNFLEMKRRVVGITFEYFVIFIGKPLNILRQ